MYLGIDIGTSAVKATLAGSGLELVASASRALSMSHPAQGHSEQTPEDWWQASVAVVRDVMAASGTTPGEVRSIGLSGQMHGAVLLDASGSVIRPAILWNDGRSAEICEALEREHPDLANIAGVRPMPGFTAPKLPWLARHEPVAYARIAHILLPKDYMGFRMHGNHVTDPSDAAGTFWFDQARRIWSPELCAATATQQSWLPEVREGAQFAGHLTAGAASELGLPEGLPVAVGAGDAAAGAIALGAILPGAGFISLGTSGQLFVTTDTFRAAPQNGVHSYAHSVGGIWFQMAAMLNGARPLSWFAEMTGAPLTVLLAEAEAVDIGGLADDIPLFLPYLTGERTPHGDARIRGAFYGLENDTSRGQMMRAVVEAVAYSFADAAQVVGAVTDIPQPLLAIGGGAQSRFLLQTVADATGLVISRGAAAALGPAMGAARLAAVAVGDARLDDLARPPPADLTLSPDASQSARHQDRLARYRLLYRSLAPVRDAS